MKTTHYILLLLAALPLAACQQDELPDATDARGEYIRFGTPVIQVETGTRSVTKDALTAGDRFGVLGYCLPYQLGTTQVDYHGGISPWGTKYRQCPPSLFCNTPVTVEAGGYCSYDDPKQWYRANVDGIPAGTNTEDYRYTFFAYYPYADNNGVFQIDSPTNASTAGAPKFTFTMPQEGTDVNAALDHSITPDAMLAVLYNRQKSQGNVTFQFSHLLTALGFEVNNFSGQELKVHSVTLSGQFFKQIELDFSGTGTLQYSFPESYYTGTYTLFDDQNGTSPLVLAAPSDGEDRTTSGLLPKNDEGAGEHILLISGPAPYFGNDVEVNISYTFGDGARTTFSTGRPETFTPSAGTKYTAQLNFVGNAFVLQFVVNNNEQWENGGTDDSGDAVFE